MLSLLNTHPPSGGNGFTDSNCSRNDGQANLAVMSYSFQYPSSGNNDLTERRSKRKEWIIKRTPPYKNQEDKKEKNKR